MGRTPKNKSLATWSVVLIALTMGSACSSTSNDDSEDQTSTDSTNASGSVAPTGGGTTAGTQSTATTSGTDATASSSEPSDIVAADSPADSTGKSASVTLNLGGTSRSLGLVETAGTLDIGGGIVLTQARVNVGSIKIKAEKAQSAAEKALKKTLEAEKKNKEKALEEDKKAIEAKKEESKKKYEPLLEAAADEAEKDTIKEQMAAELQLVEQELAALEATKDEELAALEAQKDQNLKWRGPYMYDLVNGTTTPEIPAADLTDGSYRRIEFKIVPNRTLAATDPMLNNSIYIEGSVAVAGVESAFTVSMRIDQEFKLMGAGAFKVDPSVDNALTVAFDPATWFTGVSFAAATPNALGVIEVNETSNALIWQAIAKNCKTSTRFGKDDDGDGKLKSEESAGDGQEGVTEAESQEEQDTENESDEEESEDSQQDSDKDEQH